MHKVILSLLAIGAILVSAFWLHSWQNDLDTKKSDDARRVVCEQFLSVALFPNGEAAEEFMADCLRGEPVLPHELPDKSEVGGLENPSPASGPGCSVGGCSQQICGEAGEAEEIVTTCEYREEYSCYVHSRCERQQNGECGWTETSELKQCLAEIP